MTQRPASALLSARVPPYAPPCGLGFLKACWFEVVRIPSRSPGLQEQIPLKRWDRETFCTADLRSTWQCHIPLAIPTSTQPRTAGSVACKHPSPGQGCALGEAVRCLGANFKKALTLGAARTQGSTSFPFWPRPRPGLPQSPRCPCLSHSGRGLRLLGHTLLLTQ